MQFAIEQADNPVDDSQAQSVAGIGIALAVADLEEVIEDRVMMICRDALAVIADLYLVHSCGAAGTDQHGSARRELDGVVDEIAEQPG